MIRRPWGYLGDFKHGVKRAEMSLSLDLDKGIVPPLFIDLYPSNACT